MIEGLLQMSALTSPVPRTDQTIVQWTATTPLDNSSRWLRKAQKRIQELAALPENWDSYGSRPIQPAAIKGAGDLIALLSQLRSAQPEIFPVPGGGIQLELHNRQREIEIEILPDGNIEYLITDDDGQMREGHVPAGSTGEIYRLIYWFGQEHSKTVGF
ncbi:MAG TPA: hypothetical protein VNQ79_24435 [Blastocatellia bacterium]|nr:hypothetical protein [Blastocatellia bacterium]